MNAFKYRVASKPYASVITNIKYVVKKRRNLLQSYPRFIIRWSYYNQLGVNKPQYEYKTEEQNQRNQAYSSQEPAANQFDIHSP